MSIAQLNANFQRVGIAPCEVCGSTDVQLDEVESGGRLLLAECGRCDHRYTRRVPRRSARGAESAPVTEVRNAAQIALPAEVATAA